MPALDKRYGALSLGDKVASLAAEKMTSRRGIMPCDFVTLPKTREMMVTKRVDMMTTLWAGTEGPSEKRRI